MWYKPYGKTGKDISVVGFGGMRFSEPEKHEKNAELLLKASEAGINYFDTAPGYHGGDSEKIFGAAFRQMPRESFYCSTKCMAAEGDRLRESLETSLERMNVDRIDFFHIWCIVHPEQWAQRHAAGAIDAALRARDEGLIGHVVTSIHLDGEEARIPLSEDFIEGVTLPYNALNFPYRAGAVEFAGQRGLGVVTMNPLGGGLIPNHAERLGFLCGPNDRDPVEAAIRFNISQPAITSALVGFTTAEHIDQAVAAVDGFEPYPPEHVERVKAAVNESFDGFCTLCGYCLPCPADVPIPKLMEAYNYKILSGKDQDVSNRLKWHWWIPPDLAAACLECGQCEQRCTQHLPITDRLKEVAALEE
jgi:hypothetical protein